MHLGMTHKGKNLEIPQIQGIELTMIQSHSGMLYCDQNKINDSKIIYMKSNFIYLCVSKIYRKIIKKITYSFKILTSYTHAHTLLGIHIDVTKIYKTGKGKIEELRNQVMWNKCIQ